jgi:hypothetical protein
MKNIYTIVLQYNVVYSPNESIKIKVIMEISTKQ